MKVFSLLKAVLSQDMNLFNYTSRKKKKTNKQKSKIVLPIVLFSLVAFSVGVYALAFGIVLKEINLTYVMLTIFMAIVTLLTFVEGIYKSQSILFDSKDNDLLFSLPIKRGLILFSRIFKLLLFEFLYNLMFLLPAYVVYIFLEGPGISFYLLSLLMLFLIPIIPTVISCFIGYVIKLLSSKFRFSKIAQTIFTSLIFIVFFIGSLNISNYMDALAKNATSINEIILKIYYPIGAYINLINKFDILLFIKMLLVNIIPFIIFIVICQKSYFKIISKSNKKLKKKNKKYEIVNRKPISSLTRKEIKRFFSSPVYMFNTSFGLVLLLVLSIGLIFKGKETIVNLLSVYGLNNSIPIELLFYGMIICLLFMTSITSSSISLERKTINITKTLPIDYRIILQSKILYCLIIEMPFVLASIILLIFKFNFSIIFIIQTIIVSIVVIFLNAVLGLLLNLKYPKLDSNSDAEVIKQSMSTTIAVFVGLGLFFVSLILITILNHLLGFTLAVTIHILVLIIISLLFYCLLMKKGPKEYQSLNV